jgi:hypothetical protein
MRKGFFTHFIVLFTILICGIFWLLGTGYPDLFGWFSLSWAVAGVCFVAGIVYTFSAITSKEKTVALKKIRVYLGVGLLAVAVFATISALAMPVDHIAMPIIAIAVALALLLGYSIVGGKRWDEGDNQKDGYKNYYERKADRDNIKKGDEE